MLLNMHSYYSLRYGTLSPDDLVGGLVDGGYDTAVLTDINNSSGVLEFIRNAQGKGIRGLAGMEFRNGDTLLYIGVAKNTDGFRELNEWCSAVSRHQQEYPARAPEFEHVFIIYPYGTVTAENELRAYEFIGVAPAQLNILKKHSGLYYSKCVIWAPVSFAAADYKLHRQLRAIDHNILFSQLDKTMTGEPAHIMLPRQKLLEYYKDFPGLIRQTALLLDACSFVFDFKGRKNWSSFTDSRGTDRELLMKHTMEGFGRRYSEADKGAMDRVLRELDIINTLHFSGYFLITDDICRYAREKGYHYVGRGSGANSAVAYCLGITDVDPIGLHLPFERFLNPKRNASPDFDIDFSWDERDSMYDYIFSRYPAGHTALMGAVSTFRSRSILRELGKVYGLPKADIDRLVHEPEHLLNRNEITDTILGVYNRMADLPNQRTIHASGVLISQQPLTCYAAMDHPPKGLPVIQLDMYVAEDIGFDKFDILSQRGIGHIKECCEIIRHNTGKEVDVSQPHRFFEDPAIAERLRTGNTIGCFYIESPAMRQLLIKLDCDNYNTLVAASSVVRPGVASSGMMSEYIRRHRNPDSVVYPHPVFEEQLKETYGVMVYQEDVMKIACAYGGLDMADADVLRRMMSGKYRSRDHLVEIEDKFFAHCRAAGYDAKVSRDIWRQMESFAGYSFNKAHSASYAVESYQSLYLKTYFPGEFMVAVLNNYGGFYSRKVYVNEARRAGARMHLPCINSSGEKTVLYGMDIYLGFDGVLHMENRLSRLLVSERERNGMYTGLENFVMRTGASLDQLIVLIRVGALRALNDCKKTLLWEARLLLSGHHKVRPVPSLFEWGSAKPVLPLLHTSVIEDFYDELELLGFVVSGSVFELAKSDYRGNVTVSELLSMEGQTVRIVGDFVTEKQVRTKSGALMKFGTFIDAAGCFFDTVHFAGSLAAYPLRGAGLYLLEGVVVQEFGSPAIEVKKCGKMPLKPDPRSE